MAIDFIDAVELDKDVIRRHIVETRAPNWSDSQLSEYIDWRYFSRKKSVPVLAMSGDDCLAFIDSQIRRYSVNGHTMALQESSEWYCKPKYRPVGLGVRVIQRLMARDEPVISIRGTEASQQLVLKLGWINLRPVNLFSKMINWKTSARDLLRNLRADEAIDLEMSVETPGAADIEFVTNQEDCFKGLLESWEIQWFSNSPAVVGKFHWLLFRSEGRIIGYSLVRVYEGPEYRRAQIVHADTPSRDQRVVNKMLKMTTKFLATEGALRILGRASTGILSAAFEQNAYLNGGPQPVFLWSQQTPAVDEENANFLTYLRGDDSIRPFSILQKGGDG